ncbi:MAG: Fic family protein [Chitinophagales bacterium]|jgi:Fic family protein|nr:Fic family protein [Chitinophagales bacterium]
MIPDLSFIINNNNFETVALLKALNKASRALAELKGESKTIPNEMILINSLGLQEAKESSEIENIITTQDDLFRWQIDDSFSDIATKEVHRYADALKVGFALVKKHQLLTSNYIIEIQGVLESSKSGFRKLPGTVLKDSNNQTVYMPPQSYIEIEKLMHELDVYINDDDFHPIDPLIKMAIIHYQFESIHPFYDGNGRTGRIINILYLVQKELLDIPVLYLSRYIVNNKADYYNHLQTTRETNNLEPWIIWMLNGVEDTAIKTVELIRKIKNEIAYFRAVIEQNAPKIYSKELLNNLFKYPYTKIKFLEEDLQVHRQTATNYLEQLVTLHLLEKVKLGKTNFYINKKLFEVLQNAHR